MKGTVNIRKMYYGGKAYYRGEQIEIKEDPERFSGSVDFKDKAPKVVSKTPEPKAEGYKSDDAKVSKKKSFKARAAILGLKPKEGDESEN